MAALIDSVSNPKIKHAVKLASSSKYRRENAEFILEGLRLCFDAVKSHTEIKTVFYTSAAYEKEAGRLSQIICAGAKAYEISQPVCDKLSQTQNSQGVFCVCGITSGGEDCLDTGGKYIALDNVQNPDNLGAVSRTAEAFGLDGMIISGGCDIYNPKALRASMGAFLRLHVISTRELRAFLEKAGNNGMKIYAMTPDDTAEKITDADLSGGVIAVIGNEANGVSLPVMEVCKKLTVPMYGKAESLNAATAAAVTMWEMVR